MKIIDCVTFNGEHELFDIRYNVLKQFVDEFRVIEFDQTFSGKPKISTFNQYYDNIIHYIHPKSVWDKYEELARSSPNTEYGKGAEHWVREFCQKESIKDCLTDLEGEDIVFLGDVDEIWEMPLVIDKPMKLKLRVYSYWLDNRSDEEFWGTLVSQWKYIKNECFNHLRSDKSLRTQDYYGSHFTSMGGYENVKKKLTDSYTEETYAPSIVLNNLKKNINDNVDFLGRQFSYIRDESEHPEYLKRNKQKYLHLYKHLLKL